MSEAVFNKIKEFLDGKNIEYEEFIHEPVFTSEQASKVRGVDLKTGAKAMIVRSKGKFYMFVLSAVKKIDWKRVKDIIGDKGSLATPEEVEKITDCVIGCVPPFGNLFDIPLYVDRSLQEVVIINFSAGLHTHSMRMKSKDYLKAVEPVIEEFSL